MTEPTDTTPGRDEGADARIGQVLDRLEAIEARLVRLEATPAPGAEQGLGRPAAEAGNRARAA